MSRFGLLLIAMVVACKTATPPAAVRVMTSVIDPAKQPYFSQPWPDDRRLSSDGTIPTDNFPNPGGTNDLFYNDLKYGSHLVHGWGTASPIYMPFSGEIDPTSLPADSSDTNGSAFLVVIDPKSSLLGKRAYVEFHYYVDKTQFLPGNVLAIRPVPGFPLEPKTQYALVVTTDVKDNAGYPVGAEDSFSDILAGKPKGSQEESDAKYYQPLLTELNREKFPLSKVAGATVFTTQAIVDELLVLRDYLLAQPIPEVENLHLMTGRDPGENFWLFEGTYQAPHMQHGTLPYVLTGGDFEYDANGTPIPDFSETMRLAITVPKDSVMGALTDNKYPAVMYSHGTGGDFESIVNEGGAQGPLLASKGLVGFGIDQILTGPRAGPNPGTCLGEPIEDCFFDYFNPIAGRNNLRQAALDNVFLRQVATHVTIPADINPDGHDVVIMSDRIGYLGHSQGGITGAIYAAIDPFPSGAVLSGAGGLLTATVLERQDPDAKSLAEGPFFLAIAPGETLDWYHPALALAQALAEVVDPLNYARYWVKAPLTKAKNMYVTGGLYDEDTMPDTAEYMVAAAGIPQIIPIGQVAPVFTLAGLTPIAAPVTDNVVPEGGGTAVTAGFRQYPGEGHFPIFSDPVARDQLSTFLQTVLTTGTATIPEN